MSECACSTFPEVLPRTQGIYALFVRVIDSVTIEVSGLRMLLFPGVYVYVGSAGGPGGLRARVTRHFRRYKKVRWHIDRLTTADGAVVEMACYVTGPYGPLIEACVSACMDKAGFAPIPKFGATDDPLANTHLFYVGDGVLAGEVCGCMSSCSEE